MASLQEYIQKQSTEHLKSALFSLSFGGLDLPLDTMLMICQELARRDPTKPDARTAFRQFLRQYTDRVGG